MLFLFLVVQALVLTARAWLPGEHKHIYARDGLNLFNRSHLYENGHLEKRYLPTNYGNDKGKIRGVNLGSLFVLENWMADNIMAGWGCNSTSEFDCVSSLQNQTQANVDFQGHWQTWVTASDFTQMVSYGLNTVRIPVGYWIYNELIDSSEHFPWGGEAYLDQVVGYAKSAGLYVIIDLHGAPGAQKTDAFTGQYNPNPSFYTDDSYHYGRAYEFFEWLTEKIHTNGQYSTVGMVMLVNEPERLFDTADALTNTNSMRQVYYPTAWSRIRAKEAELGVTGNNQLHIQMMDAKWDSGDPTQYLTNLTFAAYDDHNYVKYAGVTETQAAYLSHSCSDDRSGNGPVIVGEWSLSVADDIQWTSDWNPNTNVDWYKQWWAAQVLAYEKVEGWIFWTWKTSGSLNDPRWDYQKAVAAGIIPKNPDDAYTLGACQAVQTSAAQRHLAGPAAAVWSWYASR